MFYLMGVFPKIFTDSHMRFLECIPDSADQVITMEIHWAANCFLSSGLYAVIMRS